MRWVVSFGLICLMGLMPAFVPLAEAQTGRRLAIIDVEAEFVSAAEKAELLRLLKARLADQRIISVIRDEELALGVQSKNPLKDEVERVRGEHVNKRAEIEHSLEEAQRYYLASQFDEAMAVLEGAFSALTGASLALSIDLPEDILKLLSVCQFFSGKESQAKVTMATLLDLDESALFDPQKFPPPVIDLFNQVKRDRRFVWPTIQIPSNVKDVKGKFLGKAIEVQGGDSVTLSLPLKHPLLGSKAVVLEAEGYAPIVFIIDKAPKELKFVSTQDKKLPTRGLFRPIGSSTAPVELKRILESLKADVVFLGSAERLQNGDWSLDGQWLEERTGRTSPVIHENHAKLPEAVEKLISEMLDYLSPVGDVLGEKFVPYDERPEEALGKPFYKTWWFWTIVGAAAATGAGVGAYFLFKPDDKLKLQVRPAQ